MHHAPHQDRGDPRAGHPQPRDPQRPDLGRRRRAAAQLLPRHRDDHARLVDMARKAAEQAGREVGLLGDIPGPKMRLGDIEGDVMHLRNGQDADADDGRDPQRPGHDSRRVAGLPGGGQARRRDLSGGRLDPAEGARVRGIAGPGRGRDRRNGGVPPGHEPAGRRGRSRRGGRVRPRLGRLRRRARRRPAGGVVRAITPATWTRSTRDWRSAARTSP